MAQSPVNKDFEAFTLDSPQSESDWAAYYDLRWRVLREPWQQPRGSERDELDPSSFHLMLKTEAGRVVAIGRLHRNSPSQGQVRYMAVDEAWRGRGLGGRILKGLEKQAELQRIPEMVLNAREEAVKFYREHSYSVEGSAMTLFGSVRHVRMRKTL